MADQPHFPGLIVDGAIGRGHVAGQRIQRVLHRLDLHALVLQQGAHLRPIRAVGEGAVHDHDGRLGRKGLRNRACEQAGCQQ
ncbi:hypothetical protein G6F59_016784 [Rhizopus arrhizus]|nr:hypothetical protein G6F59_016784 [Rhizopus arrhizus]